MNDLDCLCGVCPPCRRSLRELDRPVPVEQPVQLSARARAILDGTPTAPIPPTRRTSAPLTDAARERYNASRRVSGNNVPTPCSECGQLRGVYDGGNGIKLSGRGTLCEVCADRHRFTARLARHENGYEPLHPQNRLRMIRALDRVLKDGRAYHPGAAQHGTTNAYNGWSCRCKPCVDAKIADRRNHRTRTKETTTP
ncbi:hypothetical protein [Rhodococcus rhodochrous]|uniref:hypothetical protein n=1 Tax=Rhodococcus rhodochrous TaxID=1829 RepID=UPI0017855F6D|nr:hypothetical protein [Rhodococcus rhodochrous]